ncbi:MAG: amidase [Halioglobus sp.]
MALSVTEYQQCDATALAGLIRNGEVSADEVLQTCIALIEELNPALNAVIHKLYDDARSRLGALPPDAPFAGVPLLLKDLGHHLAGAPQTSGNAALRDCRRTSDRSSYFVEKLAAAGFVFPGKTNVPEFGLKPTTEPEAFGPSRNPWNLHRTPGGSSGGSAAMVAAGVVPLATANDGGGSIRIPASYCGLVGLKPSRGVVSNGPHYAELWDGLNADLVVSRTVRDTAAVLDRVAGNMPGDPYAGPVLDAGNPGRCASWLAAPRALRVALDIRPLIDVPVQHSAVAATESMARLLEGLGHTVEEARPAISGQQVMSAFSAVYMSAAAADFHEVQGVAGRSAARRGTEADTRFLAYMGDCLTGAQYAAARREINQINRAFGTFYRDYDVYLTPTTVGTAHELGALNTSPALRLAQGVIRALRLGRLVLHSGLLETSFREAAARVPYTQLANLSGLPSISLPLFRDERDGLPVGVMLTAALGNDGLLLQVARQLEMAHPWISHYPFAAGPGG